MAGRIRRARRRRRAAREWCRSPDSAWFPFEIAGDHGKLVWIDKSRINKTEQHALNRSTTEPLDDAVYGACCGGFSRLLSAINERAAHHRVGHVALLFQTAQYRAD